MDLNNVQLKTSWNNGMSTQERSRKRIKQIRMKDCRVSLGIRVSHVDFTIAVSEENLGNSDFPLQTGTSSWGAKNTVLLGPDAAVVASGEVREEFPGGRGSVTTRSFYIGTSGIILRISSVIYWRGTWDFKNSQQKQQRQNFQFNRQTTSSTALTAQPTSRTVGYPHQDYI